VGLLSGRHSPAVARRAEELRLVVARQGVRDKPAVLREILAELHLELHEVAYIGDDLNDLGVLGQVGLSAAPADAPFDVRAQVFMTLQTPGGQGCFREFVDAILRARGDWDRVAAEVAGVDLTI
jgi:3-deoxy-D-manno-octulosonate 8-phosphate phosphatase (KDO 8-P phosphatase)